MEIVNTSKGIGGQLSEFRKLVQDSETIMFMGSSGFCTPFAELTAYVIRKSGKKLGFIPDIRFDDAKEIITTDHGMQLGDPMDPHADTVVLLGGLAMPKIGVDAEDMKAIVSKVLENAETSLIIGICFQSIFEKQGWIEPIEFDYIIDSDITTEVIKV
ncbi:MAG: DUF2124 domain-containing protein [Euryarchaeota archaeon]|nr:DUF2124 domain-containing protein [Euryarchaeota archaeon]